MRPPSRTPVWIPPGSAAVFPDPQEFDEHGLVAGGGDLSEQRILAAYRSGLFPWYDEPPILWWSPDPRALASTNTLHISRSLKRTLRKTNFRITVSTVLEEVMNGCADRSEGTWLNHEMKTAYLSLAKRGYVHSYEVWDGEELVGGLYGLLIGGLFAAESKFHRRTNASKLALVASIVDLAARGVSLYDVQFTTDHLKTLGVHEISRADYLARLSSVVDQPVASPASTEDILPRTRANLGLE